MVQAVFGKSFEDKVYSKWNSVVEDNVANSVIRSMGKSKAIDIENFITDLNLRNFEKPPSERIQPDIEVRFLPRC